MKVKVKPVMTLEEKRSLYDKQKEIVGRIVYYLRGICDSRDWDTACKGCPFHPYCQTEPYTWDLECLPRPRKMEGRK